jgi:hypothetical protein
VNTIVSARVVADEQDGTVVGDVAQSTDLATEPDAREQPEQRELLADVIGVALVEVSARNAALDDARELAPRPAGERR